MLKFYIFSCGLLKNLEKRGMIIAKEVILVHRLTKKLLLLLYAYLEVREVSKMIVSMDVYVRKKKVGVFMNKSLENVYMKNAEQILKENNISLEPPIDLDGLVKKLGIRVREHDFSTVEKNIGFEKDSILGATLLVDDEIVILHKKYENKRNNLGIRFTIAHELGLCVLHAPTLDMNHLELRSDTYNKDDQRERKASTFAGELLIPDESLKNICKRLIIPSLSTLAKIFDVSIGVMKERLNDIGIMYFDDTVSDT